MKIEENHLMNFVDAAHNSTINSIKKLSQKERKFLIVACEIFKTNSTLTAFQVKKLQKLNARIEKLSHDPSLKSKSNCLVSFLKFLGNILHLRISSMDMALQINSAYKVLDVKHQKNDHDLQLLQLKHNLPPHLKNNYEDCMSTFLSLQENLKNQYPQIFSEKKLQHIECTIEGFCKVAIYRNQIKQIADTEAALHELFIKTRMALHKDVPLHQMLDEGPELLFGTFVEAKKNDHVLEFYRDAFGTYIEDPCMDARHSRIAEFFVREFKSNQSLKVKTLPILLDPAKTKKDNIGFMIQGFQDIQFEEYKKTQANKETALLDEEFRQHYLTAALFKNYLLDHVKVIGQKCSDGVIEQNDLDVLIDSYTQLAMLT